MYKAMIIDDDPIVRKGMTVMIDWESLGFTICGTARDGQEGVEMITSHRPDLVITDIQMPGLNGLEMIEELKDSFPCLEVIVITGFRNFDYARQALKLGVREILLKPTRLEDLMGALNQVAAALKENEENLLQKEKRERKDQQHLLSDLALGLRPYDHTCCEELRKQGIPDSSFYLFLTESFSPNSEMMISTQDAIQQIIMDFSGEECKFIYFRQDNFRCAYIALFKEDTLSVRQKLKESLRQSIEIVKTNLGVSLTLALSSPGKAWDELREKFMETENLIKMVFFYGRGSILEKPVSIEKSTDSDTLDEREKKLLQLIKEGQREEIKGFLKEEFLSFTIEGGEREIKKYHSSLIHRIYDIRQYYQLPQDDEWEPVPWIDRIMHAGTVDEVHSFLIHYSLASAEEIFSILNQGKVDYVDKAKTFLKKNFHQDISLQQTADFVCVSSFYLSRIFTQSEGISFSSYLNQLRINEAKKLFLNTELKSFEIGARVGIPDPYYFSKLFKKIVGTSPSQYKKEKN